MVERFAQGLNSRGKVHVDSSVGEIHSGFELVDLFQVFVRLALIPKRATRSVFHVDAEASSVDVVEFDIEYLQAMSGKEVAKRCDRIVLKVLMADIVEGVLVEHRGKVAHLDYPNAIDIQAPDHILHERIRVFQIIEHRDASDDLGL